MALIKPVAKPRRLSIRAWFAAKEKLRGDNQHVWLSCDRCAVCYEKRYQGSGSVTCPGHPAPIVIGDLDD